MSEGLNNFDIVYYINLDYRKDRLEHIKSELAKTNINECKIHRIAGTHIPHLGCLGCSKSHIKALEAFLATTDNIQTCIIFEDDFTFSMPLENVNQMINAFFRDISDFDVLMLSSNVQAKQNTAFDYIIKILDTLSFSGYVVHKRYAKQLLDNFKEGASKLEALGRREHDYHLDIYIRNLNISSSKWYALQPAIGKQYASYSDIEHGFRNWGV